MNQLTIDELAQAAGLTVRTVRSYQTRGLMDGPQMRGRVGYYNDAHVERLRLISDLQREGLPLQLAERLLRGGDKAATQMLAMRRTVLASYDAVDVKQYSVAELEGRFGTFGETEFQTALSLGLIVPHADGAIGIPYPAVLDTLDAVLAQGITLEAALGVAAEVRRLCDYAARAFVELVRTQLWEPFTSEGQPEERWPQMLTAIDQIKPLANEIMAQMMVPAIGSEIDRAFGEALRQQAEEV